MRTLIACSLLGLAPFQVALSADIHELFDSFDTSIWGKNHGYSNGAFTATYWRNDHVTVENGNLVLTLDQEPCATDPDACAGKGTAGGEVKTQEHFNYGEVEARMKAAKGEGLVTALFKYTGGHEGNPQEEVDFEILGKDPTKLQVNYFVNGSGGHEKIIDLGFDASEDFHTYKYVHQPTSIEWYVDDVLVHEVRDVPVPSYAGRIYMNLWAAQPGHSTATYWAGTYEPSELPAKAEFSYINVIAYPDAVPPPPPEPEAQPYIDQYDELNTRENHWHLSNGWSNGFFTATGWRSDHATNQDGKVSIQIDEVPCASDPAACSGKSTASAELSSKEYFGYGTVEGRLKAAVGEGLVTALFKYTGPSNGTPQEEVDMEILGKDPTKIQLNYFVNGVGGHEVVLDLGFDASEGFHTYGFTHTPDYIEWLVDGEVIHRADEGPMPSYPARVFAHVWAAQPGSSTATYWAGTYNPLQLPATLDVDYINVTQGIPGAAPKLAFKPKASALMVTPAANEAVVGASLVQSANLNSDVQRWYTTQEGEYFRIKSWNGNLCLSAGSAPEWNVTLQECVDTDTQRWRLPVQDDAVSVASVANNQCLEVENYSTNDGAAIVIAACEAVDAQLFTLTEGDVQEPTIPDNDTPTPIAPLGLISEVTPEFSWAAVTDAVSYKVWASDSLEQGARYNIVSETVTPAEAGCDQNATCTIAPGVEFTGQKAEFYVRAIYADGSKSSPQRGEFEVENDSGSEVLASVPTPLAPFGDGNPDTPEFSWLAVENAQSYTIWASDFLKSGPIYNIFRHTLTLGEASCDTGPICTFNPNVEFKGESSEFYIVATLNDGSQTSPQRGTFQVEITPDLASVPTPLAPLGEGNPEIPEFSWLAVENAQSYTVWASDFPDSGAVYNIFKQTLSLAEVGCETGTSCSFNPNVKFSGDNSEFYVAANLSNGTRTAPQRGGFKVEVTDPSPVVVTEPTPLAPVGNVTDRVPVFSWKAVTNAVEYKVWASDFPDSGPLYNVVREFLAPQQAACATSDVCSFAPKVQFSGSRAEYYVQAFFEDGSKTSPQRSSFYY